MMHPRTLRSVLVVLAVLVAGESAAADAVGRSEAPDAAISRRKPDGAFEPLRARAELAAGELFVMLPGAAILGPRNSVSLTARADFEGTSPLPALETAVVLHQHPQYDLDFTLDRGRVDLENRKKEGAVRVLVRFQRQKWLMTLAKPGAKVAIEIDGRWAPGSRYAQTPPPGHEPVLAAVTLVLSGEVEVDTNETTFALTAPPGPALLTWSSTTGPVRTALRVEKLPDWADPATPLTPRTVELQASVEKFRRLLELEREKAIELMLGSARAEDRRIGLIAAGAFDDLGQLTRGSRTDAETVDFGVAVLRNWLGREVKQPQRLFDYLTGVRKFKPAQAETFIALLNGFTPNELERPETYEVLVEYLRHDQPEIRILASWHLVRLVPAGKGIPIAANNSKEDWDRVYKRWRDLIPPGSVPRGMKK